VGQQEQPFPGEITMSFDPYVPPTPEPGQQPTGAPGVASQARLRVSLPGWLLILLGLFHLVVSIAPLSAVIWLVSNPAEKIPAAFESLFDWAERNNPNDPQQQKRIADARQQLKQTSPQAMKGEFLLESGLGTGWLLLVGLLGIIGGWRMLSLKSYGLAVLASVLVAIPCISPGGCCCLGQIVGIYSLIVLLSADVRAAFQ
jgi:hypothetical protein